MKTILTGALAALTLGGAMAAAASPAAAQPGHWRGGHERGWRGDRDHDRGFDSGAAALLGFAAGAMLGGAGNGYYARPAYAYPSYGYAAPGYYAAVPRCRIEMRWNPYWRGYDRVRVCY